MNRALLPRLLPVALAALALGGSARGETLRFAGRAWTVRAAGRGGPGPNEWEPSNAFVDAAGALHLKLTHVGGQWRCVEVSTEERLGFGAYQFWINGRLDTLDRNVVFGLFNYPTADLGPDGTHEIDIEFSHWGNPAAPIGNYTVWPSTTKFSQTTHGFPFVLNGDFTTHRFLWRPESVEFESLHGHYNDASNLFARWVYQPPDPAARISQRPEPLHMNLWCFQGRAPSDGQEVELVVQAFKFIPMEDASPKLPPR